jgi:peptidoglycan/xylan/chitin deacetylase (PgdA/CDA1 family)
MRIDDHRIPLNGRPRTSPGRVTQLAASAAMATYWPPALAYYWPTLREGLGVEARTASGTGFALTFDDGPHALGTPAVLEILAAAGVRATFFLVGEQALRHPALVDEITAAGHLIGVHCHRHRNLLRLAPRQVREDLGTAAAVLEDMVGAELALYRPPYGILNAAALRFARRRSWRTVLWSDWGRDWEAGATPQSIVRRLMRDAGQGSVGLLHDSDSYSAPGSWERTARALPRLLEELTARGLTPVEP